MDFPTLALAVLALVSLGLLGHALFTGEALNVLTGGFVPRDEEPGAHFLHLCAFLSGAWGGVSLVLAEDLGRASWSWRLLLLGLAILVGYRLLRAWTTGVADSLSGQVRRKQAPTDYWVDLIRNGVFLIGLVLGAAVLRDEPPPTFYERVSPVLDDVRAKMPLGRYAPEFHQVRVDPESGTVCGEVRVSNGFYRRFYGKGDRATLDEPGMAGFDAGYAEACSGAMAGPDGV